VFTDECFDRAVIQMILWVMVTFRLEGRSCVFALVLIHNRPIDSTSPPHPSSSLHLLIIPRSHPPSSSSLHLLIPPHLSTSSSSLIPSTSSSPPPHPSTSSSPPPPHPSIIMTSRLTFTLCVFCRLLNLMAIKSLFLYYFVVGETD